MFVDWEVNWNEWLNVLIMFFWFEWLSVWLNLRGLFFGFVYEILCDSDMIGLRCDKGILYIFLFNK